MSSHFELTHIFDRRADRQTPHSDAHANVVSTARVDDILQSDVDIVVEAVGGVDPAAELDRVNRCSTASRW